VIDLDTIDRLAGGRLGTFDTTCPLCSAGRHSKANRRAKVFRIWRNEEEFATYYCVHCGESGYTSDNNTPLPDPKKLEQARKENAEQDQAHKAHRLSKARWLWSQRKPIVGSIVERYLREKRGISCRLPATLGFLPGHSDYPPAMIAAFGLAHEIEPGVIEIADDAVRGVHLTRLLPDGSDRERGERAKIMIGHSTGSPIVLAPPNDLLGLAVTEGVEDALSAHETTGLGAWAAGCASRLPALSSVIPSYIECITLIADDDPDGRRHAAELARCITARGIEVYVTRQEIWRSPA
jgi:Toprim domain